MRQALIVAALATCLAIIYVPDIGHGFIKDDFVWITHSRSENAGDLLALFRKNTGFYRPVVAITFAADYAVWGLRSTGYGITNLLLLIADTALLYGLARQFALPRSAAILASAVWAFNFHGVNMALLWLSGRTSLVVTLFALATALAALRGRRWLAGLCCLAALLSKEEAALLPLLFTAFFYLDPEADPQGGSVRTALRRSWTLWAAFLVYALLRSQSGAFTPADAPSYYQFTTSVALIARNVAEYADRAGTVSAAVALVLWIAGGMSRLRFEVSEKRVLLFGVMWIVATYATTVLLPVRSSLYALLPSAGSALMAGAVAASLARTQPARFARAAGVLIVLVALLIPVYRARNERWVRLADTSAVVVDTIARLAAQSPEAGGRIVLVDSPGERVNLDATFGTLFPEAVALTLNGRWQGEILSPATPVSPEATIKLQFTEGRLTPM